MEHVNEQLSKFLTTELEARHWSMRELGRKAGVSGSLVSEVVNGNVPATSDFCLAVARALQVSGVELLQMAGHLPGPVRPVSGEARALNTYRNIPDYYRDVALRVLAVFVDGSGTDFVPEQARALRPGESFYLNKWSGATFTKAMALLEALTPDQFDRLVELVQSIKGSSLAQEDGEREGRVVKPAK